MPLCPRNRSFILVISSWILMIFDWDLTSFDPKSHHIEARKTLCGKNVIYRILHQILDLVWKIDPVRPFFISFWPGACVTGRDWTLDALKRPQKAIARSWKTAKTAGFPVNWPGNRSRLVRFWPLRHHKAGNASSSREGCHQGGSVTWLTLKFTTSWFHTSLTLERGHR